jgi:hypothetical protein
VIFPPIQILWESARILFSPSFTILLNVPSRWSFQGTRSIPNPCGIFNNILDFTLRFVNPSSNSVLASHQESTVCDCLFNISAAALHIWEQCPPTVYSLWLLIQHIRSCPPYLGAVSAYSLQSVTAYSTYPQLSSISGSSVRLQSTVCDCLFNISAAALHIWEQCPPTTWGRAVPLWQGTRFSWLE